MQPHLCSPKTQLCPAQLEASESPQIFLVLFLAVPPPKQTPRTPKPESGAIRYSLLAIRYSQLRGIYSPVRGVHRFGGGVGAVQAGDADFGSLTRRAAGHRLAAA